METYRFDFLGRLAQAVFTAVICFVMVGFSVSSTFAVAPDGGFGNASGTYTYAPGASGPLVWNITSSDFICDGPSFGMKSVDVVNLTETELVWQEGPTDFMIWTRPAGTAGDITGAWNFSDPDSGNSYALTFDSAGFVSITATILQCSGDEPPTITSFSPASGVAGSLVRIDGNNFSPLASSNTVLFNGVPAVVTGVQSGHLFAVVPSGATSGNISVTVFDSSTTAISSTPFSVTAGTPAASLSWGGVHHRIGSDGVEFDALDAGISSYATSLAGMTLSVSGPNGFYYSFSEDRKSVV